MFWDIYISFVLFRLPTLRGIWSAARRMWHVTMHLQTKRNSSDKSNMRNVFTYFMVDSAHRSQNGLHATARQTWDEFIKIERIEPVGWHGNHISVGVWQKECVVDVFVSPAYSVGHAYFSICIYLEQKRGRKWEKEEEVEEEEEEEKTHRSNGTCRRYQVADHRKQQLYTKLT